MMDSLPPSGALGTLPPADSVQFTLTFTQGIGTTHSTATQQLTSSRRGVDSTLTNDVDGWVTLSPSPLSIPEISAVPQKLSQKILAGDYIKMAEPLQDTWRMEELLYQQLGTPGQCSGPMRPRKKSFTDIFIWIECFTIMAAVVTATRRYLEKASQ